MGSRERRLALSCLIFAFGCVQPAQPVVVLDGGDLDALFRWEAAHGRVPDGATVVAPTITDELAERAETWRRWQALETGSRAAALPAPPAAPQGTARVIEFGWDIPDPAYLRANITVMEQHAFDGVVLDVKLGPKSFAWITEQLPDDALAAAQADLEATAFKRFQHNFLRLNAAGIVNAELAARFVHDAGLNGIFFDTEPYDSSLWEHESDDTLRRRGRAFGEAFRAAPGATILLSFGYSHGQKHFNGLASFLDGMIDGLPATVEVVDGYENSYGFKTREAFARGRAAVRDTSPARVRVGFGLWLDFESGRHPWPAQPHFSPAEFASALRAARAASDGWVWVYTERLNWWTAENLPDGYRDVLRQ